MSARQRDVRNLDLLGAHAHGSEALSNGNIGYLTEELNELLDLFEINLDRKSASFHPLGLKVLRAHVEALNDIMGRRSGEPIDTPHVPGPASPRKAPAEGESLWAAFEGWKKAKTPSMSTLKEFERAIRLFEELHGEVPVRAITRPHVRQYREALQRLPKRCQTFAQGRLISPEGTSQEGTMSAKTINKLMSGPQAIIEWSFTNGFIPEDTPWSNPFNGKWAAAGSHDHTVKIWDLGTGDCQATLCEHSDSVRCVAFTPDGTQIFSGSEDNTICQWNSSDGRLISRWNASERCVLSLAVLPDGTSIVSSGAGRDPTLKLWNVATQKCRLRLIGHTGAVTSVALTQDGKHAVSGSYDKTVRLRNLETGACLATLQGHSDNVNAVQITAEGRFAFSGSKTKPSKSGNWDERPAWRPWKAMKM